MKGIKTGGRMQGVPNHSTTDLKRWVKNLLETNQATFEADLMAVEPVQRLQTLERLLKFVIAQPKELDPEIAIQLEYAEMERLLATANDEVIEKLATKLLTLKKSDHETK